MSSYPTKLGTHVDFPVRDLNLAQYADNKQGKVLVWSKICLGYFYDQGLILSVRLFVCLSVCLPNSDFLWRAQAKYSYSLRLEIIKLDQSYTSWRMYAKWSNIELDM